LSLQAQILTLRKASNWREFSNDQQDKLMHLIASHRLHIPPTRIIVDSVEGNLEAQHFGSLLAKALSDATASPIGEPPGLSTCVQCIGAWVCVNENAAPTTVEDGRLIRDALEQSGVKNTKFCDDPKNSVGGSSIVKILIGPKE